MAKNKIPSNANLSSFFFNGDISQLSKDSNGRNKKAFSKVALGTQVTNP